MHWKLTRKDTSDHVDLPEDMYWQDEFDWQALAQATPQYSLRTLAAWADVPELEMTLSHPDGRSFNTCFARPALSNITPAYYLAPEDGSAQYEAPVIHLMTI